MAHRAPAATQEDLGTVKRLMIIFLFSLLADSHHSDSGEFTLLRGNLTRAGGGKDPLFLLLEKASPLP